MPLKTNKAKARRLGSVLSRVNLSTIDKVDENEPLTKSQPNRSKLPDWLLALYLEKLWNDHAEQWLVSSSSLKRRHLVCFSLFALHADSKHTSAADKSDRQPQAVLEIVADFRQGLHNM